MDPITAHDDEHPDQGKTLSLGARAAQGDAASDPNLTRPESDSTPEALPDLPPAAWRILEERVEAFEAAWARGERPRIRDYLLDGDDPTRGQLLIELLHTDLEFRINQETLIDDYRDQFPELADRPDVLSALCRSEGRILKKLRGRGPTAANRTARQFPPGELRGDPFPSRQEFPLPQLPGYQVRHELGRGGMGIVYAATDKALGRTVAIKTILPGGTQDEQKRLRREAGAAARISHPHAVAVFQAIECEGNFYIVSEYLSGGTLASRLTGVPWLPRQAGLLVESLTHALSEAHRLGIVHRDLKPANILFTADDIPKIGDFGLVKRLDVSPDGTRTDVIAGSPSYMAPEQVSGEDVGKSVDIWALGVILYELLTGRPPFRDVTILGTMDQVRGIEPVAPRRLVPQIPRDLETICLHCLEKDPERRFATADDLAEDLHRFAHGESVKSRPVGRLEHLRRWATRNMAVAVMGVLLLASLAIGVGASLVFGILAKQEANRAEHALQRAELSRASESTARRRAERILFAAKLQDAHSALAAGDPALATDLIARTPTPRTAGDRFVLNYLDRLVRAPGSTIDDLGGPAYFIAFSPDESLLAACGAPGEIRFYETGTWKPAGKIVAGQGQLNSVAFSSDGQTIASAGDDGSVVLWDRTSDQELWRTPIYELQAYDICFVLGGTHVAVCGRNREIVLIDASSGEITRRLKGHSNVVQAIVTTTDGNFLVSMGDDYRVIGWDLVEQEKAWVVNGSWPSTGFLRAIGLSDDETHVVVGSSRSVMTILETKTGELIFQGGISTSRLASDRSLTIRSLALGGLGIQPVIALDGGTIIETQLAAGKLVPMLGDPRAVWRIPRFRVRSMLLYDKGRCLITASDDGYIDVWYREAAPAWTNVAMSVVEDCAWIQRSDGQNLLVTVSNDSESGSWLLNPQTGSRSQFCAEASYRVCATPDGRYVVISSGSGGSVRAYDLSGINPQLLWRRTGEENFQATFAPDQRYRIVDTSAVAMAPSGACVYLLAQSVDKTNGPNSHTRRMLLAVDPQTERILARRELEYPTVRPVVSPDNETVVIGTEHHAELRLLRTEDLSLLKPMSGHRNGASAMAFSSDGRWLATARLDLKIHMWRDGRREHSWRREAERVTCLDFSPDGNLLLTSSETHPPVIWDIATEQALLEPGRYPSPAREGAEWFPARFSRDGKWIAIAHGSQVTFLDGRPLPVRSPPVLVRE